MSTQEPRYTAEEISKAADIIRGSFAETGRYPTPIFFAICETALLPTVELIVTKQGTDKILLIQRDDDDPYFAGIWHIPGVMVALDDAKNGPYKNAINNAAMRARDELEGTRITSMVPLSPEWLNQPPRISNRGGEISTFYGAYLMDDEPKVGRMFDAHELPEPMLENHRDIAARAPEALHLAYASLPII
jgi:ADP-ribose pyrophosphatase YjhB (NUDIX family)